MVYYGDEIGMTGFQDEITKADTRDPYVSVNCEEDDANCYLKKSRDPMRTPMQVTTINKYTFCFLQNKPINSGEIIVKYRFIFISFESGLKMTQTCGFLTLGRVIVTM